MTERNRKAIVSEDGQSIEIYSEGNRYVIALGFSVWEWIEIVKKGKSLPKKKIADMSPMWSLGKET
jgi:hypothetical protein